MAVRCGLSPLARGTHVGPAETAAGRRFIPAHAGNTDTLQRGCSAAPVYPRSRGEHQRAGAGEGVQRGLSPLTRGTLADSFR